MSNRSAFSGLESAMALPLLLTSRCTRSFCPDPHCAIVQPAICMRADLENLRTTARNRGFPKNDTVFRVPLIDWLGTLVHLSRFLTV